MKSLFNTLSQILFSFNFSLNLIPNAKSPKGSAALYLHHKSCISLRMLIVILALIINNCPSLAQFTDEMGDICYDIGFRYVTTDIDPIEGLYSVSVESKVLLDNDVVKQQHSNGSLLIYSNSNGTLRDYNNKFEFIRIGHTQTYDVNILWPKYDITKHKRIRIESSDFFNVSFVLTYEMPQSELKERFGAYYVSGLKAIYTIQCKKIIPDKKLIEEATAILKKHENAETLIWAGTGFSISNDLIATNFHVIDKAKSIYIKNKDIGDTIPATLVTCDEKKDIAILSVKKGAISSPKYSISTESQKTGTGIFVLGYPLTSTMGNEIRATSGIISSQTGYKNDSDLYQISAPIQPGNSGGPVFDMNGNVVGIVCAHHTYAENVGYAIKTAYLMELLVNSHIPIHQSSSIEKNGSRMSDFIEQFKTNIYQIICVNK